MIDESHHDSDSLPRGTRISDRYEIDRLVGSGAMGTVYRAFDQLLDGNIVAIKVLHGEFTRDSQRLKRFLREVQLMRLVNHPNVVRTFDVGVDDSIVYFTMEYIDGFALDDLTQGKEIEPDVIIQLALQLCQGLDAIHEAQIIHRDLKPANIMVNTEQLVKISDFGVARPTSSNFTEHREIMGTVDYIAPEILCGCEITLSVDYYSLGAILYELCIGRSPFAADNPGATMRAHVEREPAPPRELRPELPKALSDLILRMLLKDPEKRLHSSHEAMDILEQCLIQEMESARPIPAVLNKSGETQNQQTLRSAASGIIFRDFPFLEAAEHSEGNWQEDALQQEKPGKNEEPIRCDVTSREKAKEQLDELQNAQRVALRLLGLASVVFVIAFVVALLVTFKPQFPPTDSPPTAAVPTQVPVSLSISQVLRKPSPLSLDTLERSSQIMKERLSQLQLLEEKQLNVVRSYVVTQTKNEARVKKTALREELRQVEFKLQLLELINTERLPEKEKELFAARDNLVVAYAEAQKDWQRCNEDYLAWLSFARIASEGDSVAIAGGLERVSPALAAIRERYTGYTQGYLEATEKSSTNEQVGSNPRAGENSQKLQAVRKELEEEIVRTVQTNLSAALLNALNARLIMQRVDAASDEISEELNTLRTAASSFGILRGEEWLLEQRYRLTVEIDMLKVVTTDDEEKLILAKEAFEKLNQEK